MLGGCSREQFSGIAEKFSEAAPSDKPAIVIDSGTMVNIGGGRVAAVYGQEDAECGGPINFTECKVVKVEPGLHQVTLVSQNDQHQTVRWDEPWEVKKTGKRYRITRPDGTIVSSAVVGKMNNSSNDPSRK